MNPKGILFLVLMALFGAGAGMSQIQAGDAVRITIKGVPAEDKAKIDADYPVGKDGTVKLPYLGEVKAAGKTPGLLARDIEKAYVDGGIFMMPAVDVLTGVICGPDVHVIHIGGQVGKPGPMDFTEGMTIRKAITAAGGATEFGSLRRVKLYRDGEETAYDMTKKENHAVPLKANDTIVVPQKSIGCL